MGSKIKEEAIRNLIRIEAPDILLLQETKMEEPEFLQVSKKLWKNSDASAVAARGASGGLGALWNGNRFSLVAEASNTHWEMLKMQHVTTKEILCLFNVYVLVNAGEKKSCWDSLRQQADLVTLENVIIAGDLNTTLHSSEKRGGSIVRDSATEWVEDLLQDWDLLDIKPVSGMFTWSNKRIGPSHIAARLDRFLVHSSFLLLGLDACVHILPCSTSDHKPIKLTLHAHVDLGHIPFKFSPLWIKEPKFLQVVKESWSHPVTGSPFYIWEEKIRRLKFALKHWSKSIPNPAVERKNIQSQLEANQLNAEEAHITKEALDKEAHLEKCYHKVCLIEEEMLRIKSRCLELKAGERNTSFFHKHAEARKGFNSISEIKEADTIHKDFASIKRAAHNHFKGLYSEENNTNQNFRLLDGIPSSISVEMNHQIESEVTMDEVKRSLYAMNPDKSPGPDGFTASLLQNRWDIMGKDLYKMVHKSQACQKLGGSTNSSFLALIPKEKGANNFNRFRPISLCNIGYKLITKVIANRLRHILPKVIPENQGGFIHGRNLVDNFTLVQEAILSSQQRKEQVMAIKLDLANAFDRVNHSFLLNVLKKFGFGARFINWIWACISEPWIAPLVNGRSAGFFKATRGLRQGCPMSPLLFLIQASVLSFHLNNQMQEQEISGISIARGVQNINHVLFADDTLLLGTASIDSARKFKETLDEYCMESGSSLNKSKCHTYCWNTLPSLINSISICLGFAASLECSSFKYLGLPLFLKRSYSRDWMSQVEKFKSKLQAWGANWLNMAGKTILIKAVLSSLPLFQFFVILAPKGIIQKMEQYIRHFFWKGGKHNERRFQLIKWETVLKPMMEGGLNFKNLLHQNIAMGAKLIWRLIAPKPGWAQTVLWRKYFKGARLRCLDGPLPQENTSFGKLCSKVVPLIQSKSYWIPGNGRKINLWTDQVMDKETIGESPKLKWAGWSLPELPPDLHQEAAHLIVLLNGIARVRINRKDRRGWGDQSIGYTVTQGYACLNAVPNAPIDPAPWKAVWGNRTLPKIDIFCWTLCHKKILTEDKLQSRGFCGPSRCSLCQDAEESATHLIPICKFSIQVWRELMEYWNSKFKLPATILNLFGTWKSRYPRPPPKNKGIKAAWASLLKICCWQLWLERNSRVFRNIHHNAKTVAAKVKSQLKECWGDHKDNSNLNQLDRDWGSSLNLNFQQNIRSIAPPEEWKIRETSREDFQNWIHNQRMHSLFFGGDAKGNSGNAGAGGVIKSIVGAEILHFAWGLGINSSIQAETFALFQVLKQLQNLEIKEANILGDSEVIIKLMVTGSIPRDLRLARLIQRIRGMEKMFQNLKFYHVLRDNNKEADLEANKSAQLSAGTLNRDGEEKWVPIP
eukprot:PITA_06650